MTRLDTVKNAVIQLTQRANKEQVASQAFDLAKACQHLANTYSILREVEIHEQYHMGPEKMPGEGGPIHGGGVN